MTTQVKIVSALQPYLHHRSRSELNYVSAYFSFTDCGNNIYHSLVKVTVKAREDSSTEQQCTYHLPAEVLCAASDYFKDLLTGPLTYMFPRDFHFVPLEPSVFETFIIWLFKGTVTASRTDATIFFGLRLYKFGEKIRTTSFQNAAMHFIFDLGRSPSILQQSRGFVLRVFEFTTSQAHPLRKYAAMLTVLRCQSQPTFFSTLQGDFDRHPGFMDLFWQELQSHVAFLPMPSSVERFLIDHDTPQSPSSSSKTS